MMRIALYIDDGINQIVLTPESQTEKAILGKLHDEQHELLVMRGEFYECRGGWTRQGANGGSTILVLTTRAKEE